MDSSKVGAQEHDFTWWLLELQLQSMRKDLNEMRDLFLLYSSGAGADAGLLQSLKKYIDNVEKDLQLWEAAIPQGYEMQHWY